MNEWDAALLITGVIAAGLIVSAFRMVSRRFTYEMRLMTEEREAMETTTALLAAAVELLTEVRQQQQQGPSTTTEAGHWWMQRADDVIRQWQEREG